jgi:hypothetical protein
VDLAGTITEASDRTGASTKALQEWAYAARQSGSSIEAVTRYLEHLAQARERRSVVTMIRSHHSASSACRATIWHRNRLKVWRGKLEMQSRVATFRN